MALPDPPVGELKFAIVEWPAGRPMYRVHSRKFDPDQFNPTRKSGRFKPFNAGRKTVSTIYVSDTEEGALGESVFRATARGGPPITRAQLFEEMRSCIIPECSLRLVDLTGRAFKRLGLRDRQLVECDPGSYHITAKWGKAFHSSPEAPDGIYWRSRQFDDAHSAILFGDRVKTRDLNVDIPNTLPLWTGPGFADVEEAATDIGITLIV